MRLFADTSFYVAIVSPRDHLHETAKRLIKEFNGRVITTEYVMVELTNWLASVNDREVFVRLNRQLRSDPKTMIVPAQPALYDAGVRLYTARPDKEWSMTDCISFTIMRQFGITQALTADHHFIQAGYNALLKS